MKDKLLQIINHYGVLSQLKYFQSEVFELNEAIICEEISEHDDEVNNYKSIKDITEEIADVMVMINQFMVYYNITKEQVLKVMEYKIDRQIERIENEKSN